MLSGMRKASKNWLGRTVMTLIMGLLVLSFGLFGISNWLGGGSQGALAKIGASEISFDTFRNAFNNELQRLTGIYKRQITTEQAKAAGIDTQVLSGLMTDLTLDEKAKLSNLHISEDFIVKQLAANPALKTKEGQFDRIKFAKIAKENGLSEAGFIAMQRQMTLRQQLVEAVGGGVPAPKILLDAMNRQRSEERNISYIKLTSANLPPIAPANDTQQLAYYNEHKAEFRAPEYRKLNLITIGMNDFAGNVNVTDEDLRLTYDDFVTAGKLGKPESRNIEQIVFNDEKEAKAVSDKIKAGSSFDAILKERNLKKEEVTLTSQTKASMVDKDVAEATFKLKKGAISPPIAGVFGFTIVHILEIEPSDVKPFESVKNELIVEARTRKIKNSTDIRAKFDAMHDSVEDLRSSGKSLAEIATALKLSTIAIESVNSTGYDKNGAAVAIEDLQTSLRPIFAANIGADTEVIRTKNGNYIWFEIANIEPARDRTLEEVKEVVGTVWLADETNRQMVNLASDTLKKLTDGASLNDIAKTANTKLESANNLTRATSILTEAQPGSALLVNIFATPLNAFGQSRIDKSTDRIVFKITDAYVPKIAAEDVTFKALIIKIDALYDDDLVSQFIKGSQNELGAKVNQRLLNSAIGAN
jgi:peptidyl-prolyl cis-trans isomerase D